MKHNSIKQENHAAYALVNTGQIRSIRIGRAIRIPWSALMDYLNRAD